jgi:arginyl-tRNA synthetase
MGVDFDRYYYESETYLLGKDIVQEGLDKGLFYRKEDGSVWADLTDEGLDEKLLLRSDGTSVYITQDLGTAELKYRDYRLDQSIYVVGNEQEYHFKVLQALLKRLERPYAEGVYHLSYGMVDLPTGKMKTREGTVVDADDLMTEVEKTAARYTEESGKIADLGEEARQQLYQNIGLGALKFFLLKTEPKKRLLFNPEEEIDFQGHTGPFVQYTHARIASVLRKSGQTRFPVPTQTPALQEEEIALLRGLSGLPPALAEAEKEMNPAAVAQYVFELAKGYNRFYHAWDILQEPDEAKRALRLALSQQTARTIAFGLHLLGIAAPEKM